MQATQLFGTDLGIPSVTEEDGPDPCEGPAKSPPSKKSPRGRGRGRGRGRRPRSSSSKDAVEGGGALSLEGPSSDEPHRKSSRRKNVPVKSTPAEAYPMPDTPTVSC